jgi:hypothetical protein
MTLALFFYLMTVMLLIFVLSRGEEVLAFDKDSGFFLPTFFLHLGILIGYSIDLW